jgi:hypothetical protein
MHPVTAVTNVVLVIKGHHTEQLNSAARITPEVFEFHMGLCPACQNYLKRTIKLKAVEHKLPAPASSLHISNKHPNPIHSN